MATLEELLIKVGIDLDEVDRKTTAAAASIEKNFSKAGQSVIDAGKKMDAAGKKVSSAGKSMTRGVTLPLVGIGVAAFKTATDFEASMAKIVGLVGVPREQVQAWEGDVRSLAVEFGKSGAEAADALFFITSAGLEGTDAIDALEASLKASAVGLGDTAQIADLATSAMNAYGSDVLGASDATDILAAAVREGKLEASELSGAMGQTLPVASAMGVRFDEVGAAFAAMSRTGTGASEAATQLRSILTSLLKPSVEAEEALAGMGLSSEGLRNQIRDEGLIATLETLNTAFDGNEESTAAVFGNVRALSGVMDMMGANAEGTAEIFDSMADSSGALDTAFAETADTAQFKTAQAMAELKDLLLEVGQTVVPIVVDILKQASEILRNLAERWKALSPEQQKFIVQAAMVVALIGPLLVGIGFFISALGKLTMAFGFAMKAFGLLSKLLMTNPWIIVIALIILLVVAVIKHWDQIKEAISSAWAFIKKVTTTVWNAVVGFLKKNWKIILAVITGPLGALVIFIASNWGKIKSTTSKVWNAIVSFIKAIPGKVASGIRSLISKVGSIMRDVWNGARRATIDKVNSLIRWVRKIPGKIKNAIPNPINILRSIGRSIIQGLINGLTSKLQDVKNLASSIAGTIKNLKGPEREDRKLLVPEGAAIIQGLMGGMEAQLPILRRLLGDVSGGIQTGVDVTTPTAAGVAVPPPGDPTRVTFDFTGIDSEMAKALRKTVRVEGGGDVQRAFGVAS